MNAREKFDALRAKYLAASAKWKEQDVVFSLKYGSGYRDSWLKSSDRKARERSYAAVEKTGDALFAHVQSISPRDWSRGVPQYWVLGELTFEDAVRPVGEALSVVPPLSYGSTRPIT